MRVSEQWLREWVDPPLDTEGIAAQLTMAGLEVDSVEPVAQPLEGVVVGVVVAVEKHPDADRLRCCQVDVGGAEPLQIVCGAANVRVGMSAPTAIIGAKLPGGLKIKRSKLRGVESFGMLCSAVEVGVAEEADGLLDLGEGAEPGTPVSDLLQLDDTVIEVDLTPNRGDCLSLRGIARELGVLNDLPVKDEAAMLQSAPVDSESMLTVEVDEPGRCPRYIGRIVEGVDPTASTPLWMAERLRRCGIRPIRLQVDVTNYVMLELGQPMHAFDLRQIDSGIRVRMARQGEVLTLLDGREVALDGETLVIADASKVLALAGIMGGEASGVADDTCNLLLESAFFTQEAVAGRARYYGLQTDSSYRFERGVDPWLQQAAIERATTLLLSIAGGRAGPLIEHCDASSLPQRNPVGLRRGRIASLLGIELADERVESILLRAGMAVEQQPDGWLVTPPGFRFDIAIEADLVEELGRIHGYDQIPMRRPRIGQQPPRHSEGRIDLELLRQSLVVRGYQEAITYSFVDASLQRLLDPEHEPIALANPLASNLSVMRTTLWSSLMPVLQANLARQQERIKIFESGLRFVKHGNEIEQKSMIAGMLYGPPWQEQWGLTDRAPDLFDIKGDIEALWAAGGARRGAIEVTAGSHPALHPGQCAAINHGGREIGCFGALHPRLEEGLGLTRPLYLFELELEPLLAAPIPGFDAPSRFPAIRRDLAIVVSESIAAAEVEKRVREEGGDLLRELVIFDLYRGQGIESGTKSLALGLILQHSSRTLNEQDVELISQRIVERLKNDLAATLRD